MAEPPRTAPALAEVLRVAAAAWQSVVAGHPLDRALAVSIAAATPDGTPDRLRAAVQATVYTALRRRVLCQRLIAQLAARPPDPAVDALLTVALAQLIEAHHAAYTVVDQAVRAAREQASTAAAGGFVNAVLRAFARQRERLIDELQHDELVRFNAPRWWIDRVRAAHPQSADQILATALEAPPLVLRVNPDRISVPRYQARLAALGMDSTHVGAQAVWVHRPRPVDELPGFDDGDVSVQDAGAQLAAAWLGAETGQRVLDACAAPGGKTCHLAQLAAIELTALDVDAARTRRISDNLRRTGAAATVCIGDARDPGAWWDGRPFDRILLDAPCTAAGIVRRHPEIPWSRRPSDVVQLATLQAQILDALWPLLKVGGRLLYVVCSIFPEEGSEQIGSFVRRHADAVPRMLPVGTSAVLLSPTSVSATVWEPGAAVPTLHDGFFLALLEKSR